MENQTQDDGDRGFARGVFVIVAAGLLLGLAFNLIQRISEPQNGLAWIRQDGSLESLEEVLADSVRVNGVGNSVAQGTENGVHEAGQSQPAISTEEDRTTPEPGPEAAVEAPPPAISDLPPIPDSDEPLEAQHETIKKFFDLGAAVFVDARSREEYEEGHIPGAIHLSFDAAYEDPGLVSQFDPQGRPIICYCDGGECELAENLAFVLIDAGHQKVLVYHGGTEAWVDSGGVLVAGSTRGGSD
jgi:rhodanese-related sulfurtransferase